MSHHEDDGLFSPQNMPIIAAMAEEMCPACGSDYVGYDADGTPVCGDCGFRAGGDPETHHPQPADPC